MALNPIRWVRFARAHRWTQRHMSDYLEGELDQAQRERAERHIHECPKCTEVLASLRNLIGALAELRGQPKRAVAAAVVAGVASGSRDRMTMTELTEPSATDELVLVRRAADGDMTAFEELVMRYADRLYAALRSFGLDDGEAQEVAQETFIRAWRSLKGFEGRSRFFTWLYRIGFNEAHRRLGRRSPAGIVVPLEEGGAREIADHGPDPATRAEQSEFLDALGAALRELPVDLRAPVVLRDVEGLSTGEAAMVLDLGEAAFKSRLHRGRMALRAVMGRGPWGPPEPG